MRLAFILAGRADPAALCASVAALQAARARGHAVVLADGGATPGAQRGLADRVDRVVPSTGGWARQLNAAARAPDADRADVLVFVPAGMRLPAAADRLVAQALAAGSSPWGCFALRWDGGRAASRPQRRLAGALANAGVRLCGLWTGDRALFVTRGAFLAIGGFDAGPARPDVDFSRRLRLLGAPALPSAGGLASGGPRPLREVLRGEVRRLAWAIGCEPGAPGHPATGP